MEEAEQIILIRKSISNSKFNIRRADCSRFLLTGKNIEDENVFICKNCGSRMTGHKPSARHRSIYICGSVRYRGTGACVNNKPIDQIWLKVFY
jgi:hypothetical protein